MHEDEYGTYETGICTNWDKVVSFRRKLWMVERKSYNIHSVNCDCCCYFSYS